MKYYQLTLPSDAKFAYEVANNINKDFPGQAKVDKSSSFYIVRITENYWEFCRDYVQKHCRVKSSQ